MTMNIDGKALQVPGEFPTDGKKRPFTIDSHLHHTRFVLKKRTQRRQKTRRKYPAVTVSSNSRTPSARELTLYTMRTTHY